MKHKLKVGHLYKVCTATNFDDKVIITDLSGGNNIKVKVVESYYGLKPGDELIVYKYSLKPLFPNTK